MSENFRQCTFKRGESCTHGFIPEWAAKVGNKVELKDFDDGGFWEVTEVGTILDKAALATQSRVYKNFGTTSLLKSGGSID